MRRLLAMGCNPTVNHGKLSSKLHQPPKVNERPDFTGMAGGLSAAGGAEFLDRLFNRFVGLARALLNPANQFILLAFSIEEIAIREFGPFFFQLALGDVPVAFDFECGHNSLVCDLLFFCFDSPPT